MTIHPLDNPIRPYAWGSRTTLAGLQGRPAPTLDPEAELWIGAHPAAPSRVAGRGGTLAELIDADPARALGPGHRRLPFLLKVLAVEQPLSLQVHPDPEQARAGFEREERAGIPLDDPRRSYRDDRPKPELICALTEFTALCGFADPAASADLLDTFAVAALAPISALLRSGDLRGAVSALLAWTPADGESAVAAVRQVCEGRSDLRSTWTARLARAYPADPGVITAMLLNLVVLSPGEALYLPGRTLHAYLYGTGVEIMSASDNVLRGGLTPKHIDVPELLAVTDFRAERVRPIGAQNRSAYPIGASDFQLTGHRLAGPGPVALPSPGPGMVLCTEGSVTVSRAGERQQLSPGQAVFLPFEGGTAELEGSGYAFHALPGDAGEPG